MDNKQKLELTWIGKGNEPKLEPRILLYDKDKSYGDENSENMLIHGDNLLALKALEQNYEGKVKCIYIDPPYNTGSRIDSDGKDIGYDDGVEHSIWLSMMAQRFSILKNLLSNDGVIFVHLDDNESDYCKVLLDDIFGRSNFMNRVTIDARSPSAFSTVNPGMFVSSEHLLYYAKNRAKLKENIIKTIRTPDYAYNKWIENPNEHFSEWKFTTLSEAFEKYGSNKKYKPETIINNYNKFIIQNANRIFRYTSISDTGAGQKTIEAKKLSIESKEKIIMVERESFDNIYILNGQQISFYGKNISEIDGISVATTPLTDIWTDIAWEGIANEGMVRFKKGKKPERLIKRCLELTTNEGDLVLDSFLGSGTTAAVAHKMNRKYIGIELGEHCYTHCIPRLEKVIDGTDQGGISKANNWQGGGGFKFYELAPSLLKKDKYDNWIFDMENYNADMLAAAMAKLSGYTYCPDENVFWKQGKAHERSYIFTTTQYVSSTYVNQLAEEMMDGEHLLICCSAFDIGLDGRYENIIIRKIPQAVLDKCDFGVSDYNMNIIDVSEFDNEVDFDE